MASITLLKKKYTALFILLFCAALSGCSQAPVNSAAVVASTPVPSPTPASEPAPSPSPTPSPTPVPTPEAPPAPEPSARLSTYEPRQGQVIGFEMLNANPEAEYALRDSHFDEDIVPFETDGRLAALIPINPSVDTGLHNLYVVEKQNGGEQNIFHFEYTVTPVEFTRQDLTVSSETAAVRTDENLRSDNEKVSAAKSKTIPRPLWDGTFIQPVEGRITTDFGQARYTNGRYTSRHSAFDIAAPTGTDVAAAASGVVVLAEPLFVSGNAVIIDHGMWLFTSYYHLDEINVSVGDEISAGDIVGTVGSTGYSTGPHLHYAATVKNKPVNPDMLKEENPLNQYGLHKIS